MDIWVQQNNSALTVHISRSYLWHLKGSFLLRTPLQPEAPGGTSRQCDEHFFFSSHDFCVLDILSSQLQNRLRFLTGSIFYSHLHSSHHPPLVPAHFLLQVPTHKKRVETVKPSFPCSSGLSVAALPMIRHLILLLVRGQKLSYTRVMSISPSVSHSPSPWISRRSGAENSAPPVFPELCLTFLKLEAFQ